MNILFAGFASIVLSALLTAVFLGLLFLVVRAGVEQGVRRALKDDHLRPWPPAR